MSLQPPPRRVAAPPPTGTPAGSSGRPVPKAPPPRVSTAPQQASPTKEVIDVTKFSIVEGVEEGAQAVLIHGAGGIGKSTLASLCRATPDSPGPVILDIEGSTRRLDVARVNGIQTWEQLRAVLQSNRLNAYGTIVIDSITKAEEMAAAHTLQTVKNEKGMSVKTLESYGWGKGHQHLYDTFLHLLADLDRHKREGRNVVLIAHSCAVNAPNPNGENFLRWEPRLQSGNKEGKGSIRNRVIEWSDHVLFLGYDIAVIDGKGLGGGTRTIFTKELPTHLAKVRELDFPIEKRDYRDAHDGSIWPLILGTFKEEQQQQGGVS